MSLWHVITYNTVKVNIYNLQFTYIPATSIML